LPSLGLGLTNIVVRPSPSSSDLDWGELVSGAEELRHKTAAYRPRLICLLGKDIFRAYAGLKRSASVDWGRQASETVPGVLEFVAPNPSGRSTIPYQEKLAIYLALGREVDKMDRNIKRPSLR
jgi:mismatch-specific thymine-DNA glycosylase